MKGGDGNGGDDIDGGDGGSGADAGGGAGSVGTYACDVSVALEQATPPTLILLITITVYKWP